MSLPKDFFQIDQIGIVVRDLDRTMAQYHALLGWGPWDVFEYEAPWLHHTEIRGEARDGHDFVADALGRGAGAAVVTEGRAADLAARGPVLAVPETGADPVLTAMVRLGAAARARTDAQVVAVTGAEVPLTVSGAVARTAPFGAAFALDDGDELQLGSPAAGVRSYLAVRGGFDAPPVLESLATDLLAGLGPDALQAGDVLGVLAPHATLVAASPVADAPPRELPRAGGDTVELRIVLGPRDDWFSAEEIERFTSQDWHVTPQSNRVGVRLDGDALTRAKSGELPSEGCVSGAIQMPPNGQPVLFLADHPLTGGYPVLGAVITDDLPLAGQLPVGAAVRFRIVAPRTHTPRTQTPGELR